MSIVDHAEMRKTQRVTKCKCDSERQRERYIGDGDCKNGDTKSAYSGWYHK